jgi:hypothetical protein
LERQTALVITAGLPLKAAIRHSMRLIDDLLEGLPYAHDPSRTELYAAGMAGTLRAKLALPRRLPGADPFETSSGPLRFIWSGGTWFTPGSCPPLPCDDNGATAWQWLHFNALHRVPPDSACFLWDIYPLHAADAA